MSSSNYAPDDGEVSNDVLASGVSKGLGLGLVATGTFGGITLTLQVAPAVDGAAYVAAGDAVTLSEAGSGLVYPPQGCLWRLVANGTASGADIDWCVGKIR